MKKDSHLADMWTRHAADWRDTAQVCTQWREAADTDPRLLESRASKGWWPTLEQLGITLFVTREYEHLALALSAPKGRPRTTYLPIPHPSGLAVDRKERKVYLASTRNPNQVYAFKPLTAGPCSRSKGSPTQARSPRAGDAVSGEPLTAGPGSRSKGSPTQARSPRAGDAVSGEPVLQRADAKTSAHPGSPLMPATCAYYPGSLYIHDLALVGGKLYANAVGHNAVVRLSDGNGFERVWWPKCIEVKGSPVFSRNHIQLNSIAAGRDLAHSFFSASSDKIGRLRPGHLRYPVDGRGVIFSGATREPICTGLTRPHSARVRGPLGNREIWVDNSGYGEVGLIKDGRLQVVRRLPGWTRGLSIVGDVAFVGTSRIIPKYACYAPGLDASSSVCAIHAVSCKTGNLLGSLEWPYGNQIFALDWIPASVTTGFPFEAPFRKQKRETMLFYSYINQ
jgi:uncharacterized protein (TIGR03032 family)